MNRIKNTNTLRLLIVPLMVLLVLLPTFVSSFHHHSEEEEGHLHCSETTAHIHEGHFECSLCFVLITPEVPATAFYIATSEVPLEIVLVENHYFSNYTSYQVGWRFLRGPPLIS